MLQTYCVFCEPGAWKNPGCDTAVWPAGCMARTAVCSARRRVATGLLHIAWPPSDLLVLLRTRAPFRVQKDGCPALNLVVSCHPHPFDPLTWERLVTWQPTTRTKLSIWMVGLSASPRKGDRRKPKGEANEEKSPRDSNEGSHRGSGAHRPTKDLRTQRA